MWSAAGLWCLVRFAPGFNTPLFYYQTNTLKFAPAFLGTLAILSGGSGLIGAFLYAHACQRLTLRPLLAAGILLNVLVVFFYLGFRSPAAALDVGSLITTHLNATTDTSTGTRAIGCQLAITARPLVISLMPDPYA
jgi:hypothetical protein